MMRCGPPRELLLIFTNSTSRRRIDLSRKELPVFGRLKYF